ncbi:hypothetical protein HMPREF9334_00375 [Selenomonas infelix ATCC 43532]|jgi:hypothetical protein|uniref:Uncharacterized protein n=2 Tax=Selenomonas TaxID=970 RepID=G5GM94_9FIRM|nr:hypothetical protein HMPREF9334_00375 [Selenomonas infelix ATCC 43532]
MLYYNKPIMGMYLAETMLNEHYRAHKKRKELAELKHFAREASVKDSRLWGKILFRIMKQETNYVLVDMVIRALPQDWQMFVDLKYRRKERVIKQTEMLHVSSSQLGIWNSAIKLNVLNALQYHLTVNDVFLRTKVINMLEVLATVIAAKEELDPDFEIVDEFWFHSLVQYYDQYSKLLEKIDDCISHQDCRMNIAVAAMVENPYESNIVLADKCGIHSASFGRYVRTFQEEVKRYIF